MQLIKTRNVRQGNVILHAAMENDARAHPRFEVDASASVGPPGAPPAGSSIQNLSLGGICIQTSRRAEVGETVDVLLRLGPSAGETLALRGQVVWVNREPPEDVGIRWIALDDAAKGRLATYLEGFRTRAT
jgi:hypothetical protein